MKPTSKYLPRNVLKLNSHELAEVLFPKKGLALIKKELEQKPKRKTAKKP